MTNPAEFQEREPGRTPGKAEGARQPGIEDDPRHEPGRTPGSAEGDRDTVESDLADRES